MIYKEQKLSVCVCTLYRGEFECRCVECLDPLSLHSNVSFLQAVFLQQVVHLQKMLPKVLRQQLDLRGTKGWRGRKTTAISFYLLISFLLYSSTLSSFVFIDQKSWTHSSIRFLSSLTLQFSGSSLFIFTLKYMHILHFLHVSASPLFLTSLTTDYTGGVSLSFSLPHTPFITCVSSIQSIMQTMS